MNLKKNIWNWWGNIGWGCLVSVVDINPNRSANYDLLKMNGLILLDLSPQVTKWCIMECSLDNYIVLNFRLQLSFYQDNKCFCQDWGNSEAPGLPDSWTIVSEHRIKCLLGCLFLSKLIVTSSVIDKKLEIDKKTRN